MSSFLSGIFTGQSKNMEKLSPNRAQLFLRDKYTVFTMGGTVALRSVNKFFPGKLQFCSYIFSIYTFTKQVTCTWIKTVSHHDVTKRN